MAGLGDFDPRSLMEHRAPQRKPFASDREAALMGLAQMTAFVPGLGDVAGLAADAATYADRPESRNWKNYLTSALGALPFVPGAAHAIFAGPLAKTADISALERAKAMVKVGVPDDRIWRETGWWVNTPDGVPRFEIDDSTSRVWGQNPDNLLQNETPAGQIGREFVIGNGRGLRTDDVIQHPSLYDAYPEAGTDRIGIVDLPEGTKGTLGPGQRGVISLDSKLDPLQTHSTAHHELQHKVQRMEGMARGGSPEGFLASRDQALARIKFLNSELSRIAKEMDDVRFDNQKMRALRAEYDAAMAEKMKLWGEGGIDPVESYWKLAGEAEARAVQKRLPFDADRRRATAPWESYDVPLNELIIRR